MAWMPVLEALQSQSLPSKRWLTSCGPSTWPLSCETLLEDLPGPGGETVISVGLAILLGALIAVVRVRPFLCHQPVVALPFPDSVSLRFDEGLGRDRPQHAARLLLASLVLVWSGLCLR